MNWPVAVGVTVKCTDRRGVAYRGFHQGFSIDRYKEVMKKKKTIWDNPEYKRLCDEHWSCIKGHDHESKKAKALMRKIRKIEREFRSGNDK